MTVIGFCSDKGSPGTTTTALAVASAWPRPAVLVEADPAGGDLALRMRTSAGETLAETPTVLTAATTARSRQVTDIHLVIRSAQQVNGQLMVVPAPTTAEQAAGVADWGPLGEAMAASQWPCAVDLGRIHRGSPVLSLAAGVDLLVVVSRADSGSVLRLRERLLRLIPILGSERGAPIAVLPVLVTTARHGLGDAGEVWRLLEETAAGPFVVDVGFVAYDEAAVDRLQGGEDPAGRALSRTRLMRSVRGLVEQMAQRGYGPVAEDRDLGPAQVGLDSDPGNETGNDPGNDTGSGGAVGGPAAVRWDRVTPSGQRADGAGGDEGGGGDR